MGALTLERWVPKLAEILFRQRLAPRVLAFVPVDEEESPFAHCEMTPPVVRESLGKRGPLGGHHRVKPPCAWHAFEQVFTTILEGEARTCYEISDGT